MFSKTVLEMFKYYLTIENTPIDDTLVLFVKQPYRLSILRFDISTRIRTIVKANRKAIGEKNGNLPQ